MSKWPRSLAPQKLLRAGGIDVAQYSLLLSLFRKLSDRQEFALRSTQVSRYTLVVIFALMLAVITLVQVFGDRPNVSVFVGINFLLVGLLLLMVLLSETLNTFLNPVETSVLAHHPISQKTYFAAKLSYLVAVVATIVFPSNVVPALAGLSLPHARWFFPLTYLISVFVFGIFVALTLCAVLGVLLRTLPTYRVRSIATVAQLGLVIGLFQFPRIGHFLTNLHVNLPSWANPLNWFVSFAVAGQGQTEVTFGWQTGLAVSIFGLFIVVGVHSLSDGYLTRVHLLLRSGPTKGRQRREWLGPVLRRITGRPSGRAAFSFIYNMAKSDWQFRISVLPAVLQLLVIPIIGIVRGLGVSPFEPGPLRPAYLLPHIGGMAGLPICALLTHSDQYRGAWIFLTAPLEGIRSFVRGIFWALWIPLSAGVTLLLPLLIWYWGVWDALLFVIYSLGLGSFYVSVELLLVDGLPFANPPKQGSGFLAAPLMFAALVAAGLIVALQWWFIFQQRWMTLLASFVFAVGAYLFTQKSFRHVETNVQYNLHVIASGRTAMFQEVE